jgi:hypothetical protein
MYIDSSDLELMNDVSDEQVVAVRFPTVDIPPGQSDVDVTISIAAEASAISGAITAADGDLSARVSTTAAITWQPEASVAVQETIDTPNIAAAVQEVVNMDGWMSNNPVCLLFKKISGTGTRSVEAASNSAEAANNGVMTPNLQFSYSV